MLHTAAGETLSLSLSLSLSRTLQYHGRILLGELGDFIRGKYFCVFVE